VVPVQLVLIAAALIALAGLSITGFLLYKSKGSSDAMKDSAEEGERARAASESSYWSLRSCRVIETR
jgi:hypothetical protein